METIIDTLNLLYKNGSKIRFLSDCYGNILWHNQTDEISIIFPDGIPEKLFDGVTAKVSINGKIFSAEGAPVCDNNSDKKNVLWSSNSLTDVLMMLGQTDTYTDTSYMLAITKSNIADILSASDEIKKISSSKVNKLINSQNNRCFEIMRYLETFGELSAVIYEKASKVKVVNLLDEIKDIADSCNKQLSKCSVVINVDSEKANNSEIYVRAGRHLLYVMTLSIIKKIVSCSDRDYFSIILDSDEKYAHLTIPYKIDTDNYTGVISDDFELYCARLYIEYLGGELCEEAYGDNGRITVSLPIYSGEELNSPRYQTDEGCGKLAEIFLASIHRNNDD